MANVIKEIYAELKLTTWSTPKKLFSLVIYSLVTCGIITVVILGLDLLFNAIRNLIL